MKKVSCGVLIINEFNQLFMGHVTGQLFFDIPKGMMDKDETPMQSAIRECGEETSLVFTESELEDIGRYQYNSVKDIHLFRVFVKKSEIDFDSLKCNSFFEHHYTKKNLPEVDGFQWLDINDEQINKNCAKAMSKLLIELKNNDVLEKKTIAKLKVKI